METILGARVLEVYTHTGAGLLVMAGIIFIGILILAGFAGLAVVASGKIKTMSWPPQLLCGFGLVCLFASMGVAVALGSNPGGNYDNLVLRLPDNLTNTSIYYAIDTSECIDVIKLGEDYSLSEYNGELDGSIVWARKHGWVE